ncbi:dienelactone hydrolase family protein [Taibaiella soli]|uniref:Dienelactone hydrolase family protein n=1 Tax=Taibaiella soli TaxID=1649169 RepID=A0A2W2BGF5_9BACT|nr:dienelactone hydrolase family protein [Taibaiella soli]PZF74977.1 dienelactone hydrolase family protein [Taibaiella soli]
MRRLFTVSCLALVTIFSQQANAQMCCVKKTGTDMQALAFNDEFKKAHLAPEPFTYVPQSGGQDIKFPTTDGKTGNAFYVPAKTASNKVLLLFHEYWGLNDYIKREAERWQQLLGDDISVYAIDLYDGKVATDPEAAGKLMAGLTREHGEAIVKGLLNKIGKGKQIATLGWCMGGTWSFNAALLAGTEAKACVMYYGFPEKDKNKVKTLQADVLYIRGDRDQFIKEQDVDQLEKEVKAGSHVFELHHYDANHAFANPSNPKYDKQNADDAQINAVRFIQGHFK